MSTPAAKRRGRAPTANDAQLFMVLPRPLLDEFRAAAAVEHRSAPAQVRLLMERWLNERDRTTAAPEEVAA